MMVNRDEAEKAISTLIRYIEGETAYSREGLLNTPQRVYDSFDELFSGYGKEPGVILEATFNSEGYDGIVLLRDIEFHSTC